MTPPPLPRIVLIAAVARGGALGKDNRLLVHLPGDLPRFKRITLGHTLLMGRKTWDSIGRPLPGRRSIVITRNANWHADGAERAESFAAALALAGPVDRVFVTGGGEIYALALPLADELLLTEIDADFEADAWFPDWPRGEFIESDSESLCTPEGLSYRYVSYQRRRGA